MKYPSFHALLRGYFEQHLKGKASYLNQVILAKSWLMTLTDAPTRMEVRTACGERP